MNYVNQFRKRSIKVNGKWVYLYRVVDSLGATIDFLLRKYRDASAAKAFFRKAFKHNGRPNKLTIDKSSSNISTFENFVMLMAS
ncbi:DDE-type integrase/transposase/recombinase [Candidatus Tisiphia endosymbiont of Dioctria rufipes]|uniref:DDE-type integrase/transposase/recombinase n=1 Tax=Candidatus Tisiphia endosymbiont of Dioctria rufipes TaxID=3066255 RepID=UPI00312CBAB5